MTATKSDLKWLKKLQLAPLIPGALAVAPNDQIIEKDEEYNHSILYFIKQNSIIHDIRFVFTIIIVIVTNEVIKIDQFFLL